MMSMVYNGDEFYEKITSIQHSMFEREKRRLQLERELFAYSRSDKRISQIKCYKLHNYLKEISDREERAKIRNLELLRDVESLEISLKNYQPDCGPLQQQMAIFSNKISKIMGDRTRKGHEDKAAKLQVKIIQHKDISFTTPVNVPPVLSVMGQVGPTSACTDHTLNHSPNRNMYSHEHLPSGLLKNSKAGIKDGASSQAYLSDDISSSNDAPDGCNLSDKHKRTSPELPAVCALTDTTGNVLFIRDSEQEPLCPVTLTQAEGKLSPSRSGLMGVKSTSVEKTEPKDLASWPPVIEEAEKGLKHSMPESTIKKSFISPGSCEIALPSSEVYLSASDSSVLSISLTQSELGEDIESDAAVTEETDDIKQNSTEGSFHSEKSDSSSQGVISLSQKGLFRLLDTIEGHFHGEQIDVYSNPSIDTKELNRIISLCNTGEDLNGEDPKICGAVVLHELQRLSWSTGKGCLLPPDLVSAYQSSTGTNEISGSLPPDAAQLWDRWFKHALLLKERHVLRTEHLVQLFTPLLLERHATYSHQAKVLLRTLLSRSSEECPSAEDLSDLSSVGLSPLPDCRLVEPQHKQHIQELQSSEEDSQDESPVESVPIRDSKAYQLLKQSAMQKRMMSSKEDDEEDEGEFLGINDDHDENPGRTKRSLHQDPYPRMERVNSKAHSALQSKAFWGESDDSNSEIEAALRPQPFSTNKVDTDDFYN